MENEIEYKIDIFPSSEKFQIFRVVGGYIWQIISFKAYYIDENVGWDYFEFIFDDPITARIICDYLNEAEDDYFYD